MKTQDAKQIQLTELLSKLGHQPVKTFKNGVEFGYLSPFREEKEPSFFVNIKKNVWYDFAESGGNIIDFVLKYKNTDVRGALKFLDDVFGKQHSFLNSRVKFTPKVKIEKPTTLKLSKVNPFGTYQSLSAYILNDRKISQSVAQKYLKEVDYLNTESNKSYFAVAFENLSGGYEIRNPFFKSSLGNKDLSIITGSNPENALIFEGFIDFLSHLTFVKETALEEDAIILNSLSYVDKAIKIIKAKTYKQVFGFLDNDNSGNEKTAIFKDELKQNFRDRRSSYSQFKDLNLFLQSLDNVKTKSK